MIPYSRFYMCTHFNIVELVDPETYKTLGESAWSLFDPYLLSTMDRIRGRYKAAVTVNNWNSGGQFAFRGFRPAGYQGGAMLSAHRRGQAFDFDIAGMTAQQVRDDIKKNMEHIDFQFITVVETDVNWVHIETSNVPNRIKWIAPKKESK